MIELDKTYDHTKVESKIYQQWLDSGFFNPDNLQGEPYTIIMPPPNANAPLHVGHALGMTVQDILVRFHRMRGRKTLWLPGTDHAGFETQVVFEKKLEKEGNSRFKMTREEFYKQCWDFVQKNKHISEEGIKRLGASCDWSRNIFTLDPKIVKTVYQTFQEMYKDGLIYRSGRICNWCPKHQTGLADLETKYEERVEPYYYFRYGPFTISTSRPETKFGDKYVVMHPADKRYSKYKQGDTFEAEWINGSVKATVIKDEAVDMEFGSGVMTITPAHDPVDFEIAQRHKLDIEQIIDKRAKLLPVAAEFAGMKILEARPKIVEKLKAKGLLEKIDENYKHNVQLCYKCGNLIEPQIVPQWYIAMTKPLPDGRPSLRDMAVDAVKNKEIEIVTEKFEKIFMHWMENIRDWPISRQIWWGIPIPVWYDKEGNTHLQKEKKIIFVRHGESTGNAKDVYEGQLDNPLTKKGLEEAAKTAQALKGKKIAKIISSDLQRAKTTAEIVAEALGIKNISFHPEFREVRGGKFEGETRKKGFPLLLRILGEGAGETLEELITRAKEAWKIINAIESEDPIVVVGHNSFLPVIKAVQEGVITKEGLIDYRKKWHLDNAGIYEFTALVNPEGEGLVQDPDTFDTWFSSGQWPFATLMTNGEKDFRTFFPTQVMETGWDILFFWVARMVMMSYYKTGKPPFEKIFLHGLVRDKDKQKMSKSKGNVVDPLGVIDTYGTDALRFALIFSTSAGNDIPLSEDKIKGMKHFANKLWNIARFVLANLENYELGIMDYEFKALTPADTEIIDALKFAIDEVTEGLENFQLHAAAQEIYNFVWKNFADVYIEKSKEQLKDPILKENTQAILLNSLFIILKLLHPFMPFVTEEIWGKLNQKELLLISAWPK